MYLNILMGLLAFFLFASQVFAAPSGSKPLGAFVEQISRKTGVSETDVRQYAVEALRRAGNGKYSRAELEKIRNGEAKDNFSPVKENEMVRLLQKDLGFQVVTGIEAIRLNSVTADTRDLMVAGARNRAYSELKSLYNQYQTLHLNQQTTQLKRRLLLEQHPERRSEIAKVEHELQNYRRRVSEAGDDMGFVVWVFLRAHGFSFESEFGKIVLHAQTSKELRAQTEAVLEKLVYSDAWHIRNRPKLVVDPANLQSESRFDSGENIVYLGFDFLRGVSAVGN